MPEAKTAATSSLHPVYAGDSTLEWWARGDAPVRIARGVVPLVDGRAAMLAMCVAFLTAKRSIWLADWDMHAQLLMVRGSDQRAGPDGSPEQEALLRRLRAAGLDDAALALWTSGRLRVVDVLGFAAQRGVDVRVLLWSPYNPGGRLHIVNNPAEQQRMLEAHGVQCRQDKNSRSPFHMAQALHQKCAAIDGTIGFAGGVDLTVEYGGDFDRWDVPAHPYDPFMRSTDLGPAPHPWHDAHLLVLGSPAQDIEHNIAQRWAEAVRPEWWRDLLPPVRQLARSFLRGELGRRQHALCYEEPVPPPAQEQTAGDETQPTSQGHRVQVVRTIPALTYHFAPDGIHTIVGAYIAALRQAERAIYLESQYLWLEGYNGIDIWRLGWQSREMKALLEELAAAAQRGVSIALVLPDHPNAGRAFTDGTISWLLDSTPRARERMHFFTLATSGPDGADYRSRYRPVYVHAKVGIVDDQWATIGSANLNSRGMSHDAELNVAVLDAEFARTLRLLLWREHLGHLKHADTGWPLPACLPCPETLFPPEERGLIALLHPTEAGGILHEHAASMPPASDAIDVSAIADPREGIEVLVRRASENLTRLQNDEPLLGQLLPYLRAEDGQKFGIAVDRERGYLDPLREQRGEAVIRHPARYT